jgi:hypothetical protein
MDPAVMLTLASISYRGCNLNLSVPADRDRVRDAIIASLNSFDKVRGQWELAWGPAGFSLDVAGLDISAMYVAHQLADPSQIVIVVRGTNLFSLTDWASNLLIEQRSWPYADAAHPGAMVSRSTQLGLSFLQRLLSAAPNGATQTASLWDNAMTWLTSHEARLQFTLLNLAAGLPIPAPPEFLKPLSDRILEISRAGLSQEQAAIIDRLASALSRGPDLIDDAELLQRVDREQQQIAKGVSLLDFLRGCVKQVGSHLDIYVTGHSKGGPLAVALATWLADTQGSAGAAAEQWDPDRHATIHSYTFAAPTPGNGAFARHFQSLVSAACRYRLFNPNDLIPHVWKVEEAQQIPTLYSGDLGFLEPLVQTALPILQPLDYQHETDDAQWTAVPHEGNPFDQIKFNHLDAYLTQLGILGGGLQFNELFKPI